MTADKKQLYYVFAFDGGMVVRCTHYKYDYSAAACREAYGTVTSCHYATARTKKERNAIATGKAPGVWTEIYFETTARVYRARPAPDYTPSRKEVQ